jgi:hypothetical protein
MVRAKGRSLPPCARRHCVKIPYSQVYLEFYSPQAATATKHHIDGLASAQPTTRKHTTIYTSATNNPFKTLPKDAPTRGRDERPVRGGGYNSGPRGEYNSGFRGGRGRGFDRGGYGQYNNNRNFSPPMSGGYNNQNNVSFQNNMGMNGGFGGGFSNRGNMMGGGMRGGMGGMRGGRGAMNMMPMGAMGMNMMNPMMAGMGMGGMLNYFPYTITFTRVDLLYQGSKAINSIPCSTQHRTTVAQTGPSMGPSVNDRSSLESATGRSK